MPIKFYEDFNAFKLFMNDCGLFGAVHRQCGDDSLFGRLKKLLRQKQNFLQAKERLAADKLL